MSFSLGAALVLQAVLLPCQREQQRTLTCHHPHHVGRFNCLFLVVSGNHPVDVYQVNYGSDAAQTKGYKV